MKAKHTKKENISIDSNRFGVCAKCKKRTKQLNAWYSKDKISEWVCLKCLE